MPPEEVDILRGIIPIRQSIASWTLKQAFSPTPHFSRQGSARGCLSSACWTMRLQTSGPLSAGTQHAWDPAHERELPSTTRRPEKVYFWWGSALCAGAARTGSLTLISAQPCQTTTREASSHSSKPSVRLGPLIFVTFCFCEGIMGRLHSFGRPRVVVTCRTVNPR